MPILHERSLIEAERKLSNQVRTISLPLILERLGATKDRHDPQKWHTLHGAVSVKGTKFYSWQYCRGGGGAIDLVMLLLNRDFMDAKKWLLAEFFCGMSAVEQSSKLTLPKPDKSKTPRVIDYLVNNRRLPESVVTPLLVNGTLFADSRTNAVFLLLGKEKKPVGAELRGTGKRQWRGMCSGSRRDAGFFYCGPERASSCVLCESAIDALSFLAMNPGSLCVSASGAISRPGYIPSLLNRGYRVYCGYDNDQAGHYAYSLMKQHYPDVERIVPVKKDWNEELSG